MPKNLIGLTKGGTTLKGYPTYEGYMGYIPNEGYVLFSCESDYIEYYESYGED